MIAIVRSTWATQGHATTPAFETVDLLSAMLRIGQPLLLCAGRRRQLPRLAL